MNEIDDLTQELQGMIPQKFSLNDFGDIEKDNLLEEVMEKVRSCENKMSNFYGTYNEWAEAWRIHKERSKNKEKPMSLHNSRVGETHRAVETLATFWHDRQIGKSQFYSAVARGYENGRELTETDLYAIEAVLWEQLKASQYKRKLLNADRSCALFGTVLVEEPWVQRPIVGRKTMEYTDFVQRPLITSFFDTSVFDLELSPFMAFADYPTKWTLLDLAANDKESFDYEIVKQYLEDYKSGNVGKKSDALNRVNTRKQRAGYQSDDPNVHELISYHGRINPESPLALAWLEYNGITEFEPRHTDFTVRVLNGEKIVGFSATQYGDWRTRVKIGRYKELELEPLAYGVGALGMNSQNAQDFMTSNIHDLVTMSLFNMWVVSKYAGLKTSQLGIKPLNIIELEDVSQLVPLRPDVNATSYGENVLKVLRSDFRTSMGAPDSLQAVSTGASATETSLVSNSASRSAAVHADIIMESLGRQHLEQSHINNLNLLESDIWIEITGEQKSRYAPYNRMNIPTNIGLKMKISSDEDFTPQRRQSLLEIIRIATQPSAMIPDNIPVIRSAFEEYYRSMGMNPAILNKPVPISQQLEMRVKRLEANGVIPGQNQSTTLEPEIPSSQLAGGVQ